MKQIIGSCQLQFENVVSDPEQSVHSQKLFPLFPKPITLEATELIVVLRMALSSSSVAKISFSRRFISNLILGVVPQRTPSQNFAKNTIQI